MSFHGPGDIMDRVRFRTAVRVGCVRRPGNGRPRRMIIARASSLRYKTRLTGRLAFTIRSMNPALEAGNPALAAPPLPRGKGDAHRRQNGASRRSFHDMRHPRPSPEIISLATIRRLSPEKSTGVDICGA